MNKSRLLIWVLLLLVLLSSIPVLIAKGNIQMAKILGGIFAALAVVAVVLWRNNNLKVRIKKERVGFSTNDKYWLKTNLACYSALTGKDVAIFEDRLRLFIANNTIVEESGEIATKEKQLAIGASAVLAFWGLPYFNYGQLDRIVLINNEEKLLAHEIQINFEEIKTELSRENRQGNIKFPSYDYLCKQPFDEDVYNLSYHQEVWIPIVERLITNETFQSTIFFKVVEKYFKENSNLLKKKHFALYSVLTQNLVLKT